MAHALSAGRMLLALDLFVAVTAISGGVALAAGMERKRFSLSLLDDTPFKSYGVPGLLLGGLVGGTSLVAAAATLRRSRCAPVASAVAGSVLVGWITGEACLLPPESRSWIEVGYLCLGLVMSAVGLSETRRAG
jgi:hypothetical protein